MSNEDWKIRDHFVYIQMLCIVDEEIREIFHPDGFVLNDNGFKNISGTLIRGFSLSFP